MIIKQIGTDLEVQNTDLILSQTIDCGQCFRWKEISDNTFYGIAKNKELTVIQEDNAIILKNTTIKEFDSIWRDYFDLDTDYKKIKTILSKDETLWKAIKYAGGIHLLKQDKWETICTFIISQNNNIPRIKGIVERLCECFGEKISDTAYSFPTAEVIAKLTVEDLAPLRAGFRAKYILDAAKKVSSGEIDLSKIEKMSLEEADKLLRTICGVGPKVSACILLFGFHKIDAFPIDVWINRALDYYYNDGFPERFKKYGGIAQQYIFHYIRTCDTAIPDEYRKK